MDIVVRDIESQVHHMMSHDIIIIIIMHDIFTGGCCDCGFSFTMGCTWF